MSVTLGHSKLVSSPLAVFFTIEDYSMCSSFFFNYACSTSMENIRHCIKLLYTCAPQRFVAIQLLSWYGRQYNALGRTYMYTYNYTSGCSPGQELLLASNAATTANDSMRGAAIIISISGRFDSAKCKFDVIFYTPECAHVQRRPSGSAQPLGHLCRPVS